MAIRRHRRGGRQRSWAGRNGPRRWHRRGPIQLVNNLPAYATIEAVIPVANQNQLLGLLVGTNVGPIVTPWASLATLLWHEPCRAAGVQISRRAFAATGLVTAVVVLAATTGALVATG